ncbi:MAG: UDP-N-acetylmuramoyl-tripeptide--D-alanyl-D-alanine ligase [Pyrinomonadaceae bacterium]
MNILTAAQHMRAATQDAAGLFDNEITGFSIDSRSTAEGELFFALSPVDYVRHGFTGGPTAADAHDFIPDAFARGAVAAVVRGERVAGDHRLAEFRDRLLLVEDVIEALQLLAHDVLAEWAHPVVGITGSAGKTTTKNLTAHVLAHAGRRVLKSQKNYNNELGLPLSILQMIESGTRPAEYDVAVLEMGMSTPNELRRLCEIAPPDVVVELLVAPVHLEFMGSIEQIAASKAQLVEGLKPGGTAVLNADDPLVAAMRDKHRGGPTLTFGIDQPADVTALDIDAARLGRISFRLRTPGGEAPVALPLTGRHNLMNALAASAVANTFGLRAEEIADALSCAAPSEMRGVLLEFAEGFALIDDSYNSNPRSLLSMVKSLAEGCGDPHSGGGRRTVVVAGEMLELGPEAAPMHREAGREIGQTGVDVLWGVRGLADELLAGARDAGMVDDEATRFFASSEAAAAALVEEVRAGDLVLIKGSRGVRTDVIVRALRERFRLKDDKAESAGGS